MTTQESATGAPQGIRYATGPTIAVGVADLRGAWNGGVFAGDPVLVQWARDMADANVTVEVFDTVLTAGDDTPLGALAALASYAPGRTIITQAPDDVLAALVRFGNADDE